MTTTQYMIQKQSVSELFDLQDKINKIQHYYEVQQELTHTIAIILHCLNHQSTDPLHHNLRIPTQTYHQILNRNLSVPAPLSLFLFQPTHQLEIHDHLIQQIQSNQLQTIDHFIDHLFQQITHSPQLPPLFQQSQPYQTLENYLQPLYELYLHLSSQ